MQQNIKNMGQNIIVDVRLTQMLCELGSVPGIKESLQSFKKETEEIALRHKTLEAQFETC